MDGCSDGTDPSSEGSHLTYIFWFFLAFTWTGMLFLFSCGAMLGNAGLVLISVLLSFMLTPGELVYVYVLHYDITLDTGLTRIVIVYSSVRLNHPGLSRGTPLHVGLRPCYVGLEWTRPGLRPVVSGRQQYQRLGLCQYLTIALCIRQGGHRSVPLPSVITNFFQKWLLFRWQYLLIYIMFLYDIANIYLCYVRQLGCSLVLCGRSVSVLLDCASI